MSLSFSGSLLEICREGVAAAEADLWLIV